MVNALGEFVFSIALVSSLAFFVIVCGATRFLFRRGWIFSIIVGAVCGLLLGFLASPYIFMLYLDFRGYSL
jgi:hypothetical protein